MEGTEVEGGEEPLVSLARNFLAAGQVTEALDAFEQAVELAPHRADLLVELGGLRQTVDDPDEALACYRQAVAADPDFIPARQNLGYLLSHLGEPEQALEHYEHAVRVRPTPLSRMLAATVLPVIYDSVEDLRFWRERFAAGVRTLADSGLRVETGRSQIPTNFLLAYQGGNDRELAADMGRIYRGCALREPAGLRPMPPRAGGRAKIGFLSAFFRDHTIGRLNLGTIQHLSRERFEVIGLAARFANNEWGDAFQRAADRWVLVPRDVEMARQVIAEQHLDVLIFSDVGMDAITSTLAYSRMAPVQCVSWGHPDTTGSTAIDYFLSSELLETAEADGHYTERLVRLPKMGVYYERPVLVGPPRSRAYFGLGDRDHIYMCPQTAYKFHPDFDVVLAGILEADPAGEIVLIEGRVRNWTDRLRLRFARSLPAAGRRVRFLPALPYHDFLSLFAVSDVVLDPMHFGGGNSSYEALAMCAPVVTLPSPFLRGRITQALYRKMHFLDLIVNSPREYVATATRLAIDAEWNREVRSRIAADSPILFADPAEVLGLEQFLWSLTGGVPRVEQC